MIHWCWVLRERFKLLENLTQHILTMDSHIMLSFSFLFFFPVILSHGSPWGLEYSSRYCILGNSSAISPSYLEPWWSCLVMIVNLCSSVELAPFLSTDSISVKRKTLAWEDSTFMEYPGIHIVIYRLSVLLPLDSSYLQ